MPPEQARGEAVGQRTDLFGFGLVLYETATGRRAFAGDSPLSLRHLRCGLCPSAPPSWQGMCPASGRTCSILALPVAAFMRRFSWVLILTAIVVFGCAVLAANRGRCPLTGWAARFTTDRAANFDIYLPNWLARNNKAIFGGLFVVNELIVLWRCLAQP